MTIHEDYAKAKAAVAERKGSAGKPSHALPTRTVGSLTAHDIGHTVTVRETTGKLRRVEHLQDGRSIIQVAAFPESFFTNEPCEVEGT